MKKYAKIAEKYAKDVISGKIAACKWTILACQRHIDDLAKVSKAKKGSKFKYIFDDESAAAVCQFIELLPHVKGEWAQSKEPIRLEPWQVFILSVVFGWLKPDGSRRFKTVYIECPRKNGKSALSSGVGLYMLLADHEEGSEVYSAATTRDQARIIFETAKAMVRKSPSLKSHFGVDVLQHSIFQTATNSKMEALSAEGDTLDGLNIHCALVDELHAHRTRAVYDVLETGTGARKQPLLWAITTAGTNRSGICYEIRDYACKVLSSVKDDSFFGIIYTIDDDDDYSDENTWKKANPNYGVSVYPDDISRLCKKAMQMASARNNFLTKRLNVWVNADSSWMDMQAWELAGDKALSIDSFAGKRCWIGIDLASKIDIAAMVVLFKEEDNYYCFGKYYLPEATIENDSNSQYQGWALDERITGTPGNVINFGFIESDLRDLSSRFEVCEVCYDPFQATEFSTKMSNEGFTMIEVRPTVLSFSEPMKNLEALVLEGKFHHDGCPVLSWMVSNVVCHTDAKDNIYPRKNRDQDKIDGVVACLMALNRAMADNSGGTSVYETRGILTL